MDNSDFRPTPDSMAQTPPGSGFRAPAINLPKGGGAIRGIGEKFAANPATGTGSLSIPVPVSPGRSGFTPALALSYDSGHGNSVFGLGWRLEVPAVTRKTDRGVPRYRNEPGDIFLAPGGEDLVPVHERRDGRWQPHVTHRTAGGHEYEIVRYRPRVEEACTRTERWTDVATGETHWRTITRDGITALYGRTADSRIADPRDPGRVFSWLVCETYDGRGNATSYTYKAEDAVGIDRHAPHERHRTDRDRSANRYLKRVRYANRSPLHPGPAPLDADAVDWLLEILLDYGEHDEQRPTGAEERPWRCRADPFSSYRSGFEIRTYRLCRRVVMLHHFADENGPDGPVLSLDLDHRAGNPAAGLTMLTAVTHRGYRDDPKDGLVTRSLPPLELEYSTSRIDDRVRTLDAASTQNLPAGLATPGSRWVDLVGEGLSGVLSEQADAWFYKENLGGARLGPQRLVRRRPQTAALTSGRQDLFDLDGNGLLDLVELGGTNSGFSERTADGDWTPWRPFVGRPAVDFRDPRVRLVDLSGDGRADVLILGDEAFTWYPSLGKQGFGAPGRATPVRFADSAESLHLADLSGDGLADLVRVRNGEVCYWPSLGHGRFGARVVMDAAPWFDEPGQFDPQRVRLADVDGSGPSDLIYLHRDGIRLYTNRSGNGWAPAHELPVRFPRIDSAVQVAVLDLLGTGTACLVWSSPLPGDAGIPLRYVDLMRDGKPHLLTVVRNNIGVRTTVSYAPSTKFALADKAAGRPWRTRAPFPVHVVEHVETCDLIAHSRYTTRYAYHEIFFDGVERESGGFALVDRWDTDEIGALAADDADQLCLPPVLTRSWFHTGALTDPGWLTHQYADRYHATEPLPADPPVTARIGDRLEPVTLTADEQRQAARALRGRLLRQEVYAQDGGPLQGLPYSVTTQLHAVELRQPARGTDPGDEAWQPAVFAVYRAHTREEHHERLRVPDPRVHDEVVLEVDEYLNVRRTVAVAHPRRHPDDDPVLADEDRAAQARTRVVLTEYRFTNAVDRPDHYRTPLAAETVTYEITGLALTAAGTSTQALRAALAGPLADVPPGDREAVPPVPARRLVEQERSTFRRDDLGGPLPFGKVEALALPWESYRLAFTADLLDDVYGGRVDGSILAAAGYVCHDDAWWALSGRVEYAPAEEDDPAAYAAAHFYLPQRFRDPFGAVTTLQHDRYDLLVLATRDAVGNLVSAGDRDGDEVVTNGNDYRVLQPRLVCDANGNVTEVGYDALGRVTATVVGGKAGAFTGDNLDRIALDPAPEILAAFLAEPADAAGNPSAAARELLGDATSRILYDPDAFHRSPPDAPVTVTLSRDRHVGDIPPGEVPTVQQVFTYSDGFARDVQHKALAEPDDDGNARWVGSGWSVFNNKGLPVRRFEAYFAARHRFECSRTAGVSTVLFYDPLGRPVATLHPDGSYDKRVFDPWRLVVWDRNDTVTLDPETDPDVAPYTGRYLAGLRKAGTPWRTWHARRADGELGPDESRAAEQTALHVETPVRSWSDPLGRTFLTVLHNRTPRPDGPVDELQYTRLLLDVQGHTLEVRDPLRRQITVLQYDLRGMLIGRAGIDSGAGASLPDALGAPSLSWNARGYRFRTEYDPLHRPLRSWLTEPGIGGERLHHQTEYGEGAPDAVARNLRTQIYRQFDAAGVVIHAEYDTQGNLARAERRLTAGVDEIPDWSRDVPLDDENLTGTTWYDALNRPREVTTPDGSRVTPAYSVAGLLHSLGTHLPDAPQAAAGSVAIVTAMAYNARGQRIRVEHGNGTTTSYEYDPETFRLRRTLTMRGRDRIQDLRQVYDPEGNVTACRDETQQRLFFRNRVVDPGGEYVYDALYRLVQATGREHLGQVAAGAHPHDRLAMARYTEHYSYDAVGNLTRMRHVGADPAAPGWTRDYRYDEPSLLEPGWPGNRLAATVTGPRTETFEHDAQGNITSMPGIRFLSWDPEDRLRLASRGPDPSPEAAVMAYDPAGTRIRKAVTHGGHVVRERVYLGPFERYREYNTAGGVTLERTTLHVLDDQRRVAMVDTRTLGHDQGSARRVRHQLTDHLGSATVELDEQARLISHEEYHPYGTSAYYAATPATEVPKRYRYTGRERDLETGLEYHGARYYAPWLGRWTSTDPSGPGDALSPYVYVRANPLRLVDPDGRQGSPPPQLFGNWRYGSKVTGRALLGHNVQIDHPIQVAARIAQRTPPGGPSLYSRAVSTGAGELGVLLETGKGRFHTVLGGFQKQITAAVRSGALASESDLVAATMNAYEQTAQITGTTFNKLARDTAILSNQAAVHRKLADTVAELQALGPSTASQASAAVAGAEQTVAAAAPAATTAVKAGAEVGSKAGLLAKAVGGAGRLLTATAPALRVLGKVAGPLALAAGIHEAATATNTAERANAAVNVTSGVLGLSTNPVTGIAAGSIVAGGFVGGKVEQAVTGYTGSRAAGVGAGTLAGAATGAAIGAVVGSIVPGVGTAIGAGVGAAAGAIGGFVKSYWSSNQVPLFAGIPRIVGGG
ncbi:SpvB/TcaC N-terminal domain-containing protein [Nonomuraea monospora]